MHKDAIWVGCSAQALTLVWLPQVLIFLLFTFGGLSALLFVDTEARRAVAVVLLGRTALAGTPPDHPHSLQALQGNISGAAEPRSASAELLYGPHAASRGHELSQVALCFSFIALSVALYASLYASDPGWIQPGRPAVNPDARQRACP
jgi:hypothetical protein